MKLFHVFLDPSDPSRYRRFAARLAGMGVAGVRCPLFWPTIETEPGLYDWDVTDEAVDAITSAGMQAYLNFVDVPAHAAGGWEGYRTWFDPAKSTDVWPRCWRKDGGQGYDPTRSPECANPPAIDTAAVRRLGTVAAMRYGARLMYGFGNEPDDPMFFPPAVSKLATGDWEPAARTAALQQSKPFAEGVRSVIPQATIVGPETQTEGFTNTMLACELESIGADAVRLGAGRWFDVISFHLYAGGGHFPEDALARIDKPGGYLAWLKDGDLQDGRRLAIGEAGIEHGEDPAGVLKFITELEARRDLFEFVTLYMAPHFFKPGTFENGTYEPNQLYRDIAAVFGKPKRRAVGK